MSILKCTACGVYTLKDRCPCCGSKTISPKPAKFSPPDRYGRYRRMMKKRMEENVHKEGCS